MSPLTVPVVCRATSGAQLPSSGGMIVLHQATTPAKGSAKRPSARQRKRVKSATIVARAARPARPAATARSASGAGSRNQSASALHRPTGATIRIAAIAQKIAAAMRFACMLRPRVLGVGRQSPGSPRQGLAKGVRSRNRRRPQRLTRPSRSGSRRWRRCASSRERGDQPRRRLAFSGSRSSLAELGNDLADRRVGERGEPHQPVGQPPGRRAPRRVAEARLQDLRDLARYEVAGDGEEALALGARVGHGAQVQVRDVAHVDDAEEDVRAGRAARRPACAGRSGPTSTVSGPSTGPNTPTGLTTAQLRAALLGDEIPGRALGDRLRLGVGADAGAVEVRSSSSRRTAPPAAWWP